MSLDLFLWPCPALASGQRPTISDGFKATAIPGVRRQHLGVDVMYRRPQNGAAKPPEFTRGFFMLNGAAILAAGPGRVSSIDRADSHGIFVAIDHGTLDGRPVSTAYRHLASVAVAVGEEVAAGQLIGTGGHDLAAGASSPNHLHFEVWDRSRPRADGQGPRAAFAIDPAPFMRVWRVKTLSGFTSPDISPAGDEDAGETDVEVNLATLALVDLAVVPGGIL